MNDDAGDSKLWTAVQALVRAELEKHPNLVESLRVAFASGHPAAVAVQRAEPIPLAGGAGAMTESRITINGVPLGEGQAMTVRVAIESLASSLDDGLGDDEHGRAMVAAYRARIAELRELMFGAAPGAPPAR